MSRALEIASERYAKGEITKAEFEEIKAALGGGEQSSTAAPRKAPERTSRAADPQPKAASAKAKSGGMPQWIWGPVGGLAILLVFGFFRYNAEIDRVERQCLSQFGNPAQCSCFIGEIRAQSSILDETPLLKLLTDQSDARSQRIGQNAVRKCIG